MTTVPTFFQHASYASYSPLSIPHQSHYYHPIKKVVILGDTNTGKTSLVVRFVSGHYQSHDIPREPTIGAFFVTKRMTCVQQNMTCKLLLWDTAGQEQYTKFASTYYQNAAAAIITYDISQPQTIQRLSYWLEELHRNITVAADRRIVLCVAACKCDVVHNSSDNSSATPNDSHEMLLSSTHSNPQQQEQQQQLQYQYALEEGKRLSEQYSAIFVNTSAKENMGISFLFEQLCHRVLQYQYEYEMNPTNVVPIPVTVVSTTTSHGVQSPTHNVKQHHQKRAPISPTNTQRKAILQPLSSPNDGTLKPNTVVEITNGTATTTIDSTTATTTSVHPITVSDESDSSRTLPTQDPIHRIESNRHHHNNNDRNRNSNPDDTILTDDQYAVPTNLRTTTTVSDTDDRSYATNTTNSHPYNNSSNICNPMCGDNDTVTAFVCGTDRNPSSCQIM